MKKLFIGILVALVAVITLAFALRQDDTAESYEPEDNAVAETTDNAYRTNLSPSQRDNKHLLLQRKAYTVLYNTETRCSDWVEWTLTAGHCDGPYARKGVPYYDDNGEAIGIGKVSPQTTRGGYIVDMEVPAPRQELDDWTNNRYGMSHGHMCPAGDNKWDKAAMNQSFLLTNMCPQDPKLNNGDWRILEERCRKWALRYGSIRIVAGPLFARDDLRTIGADRIAVPDAFFKAVLCTNGTPKAIAFIYPNDGTHHEIGQYVTTVDEVERQTGYDFFSDLSDDVEAEAESRSDLNEWQ